jgi:predicted alternative tryptophan synthase beta-subunit
MSMQTKYLLNESQMPKFWYNIQADLPKPLPAVLHPGTLQPVGPGRPGAAVSDGADPAGGQHRARD